MILAKVEKKPKKLPPYGKIETAAGCHSPVVVSGSDGNAFAGKSIETVNPNTLSKKCPTSVGYFYCYIMKNNFLKMD